MSPLVLALVLAAAVLHASWNALLKSGADRLRSITVMQVAAASACLPLLFVLPRPDAACWPALLTSTALHLGYNLFLVRAYAYGDLGQVYPVARGSSPMLVTVGAALVAGEDPGILAALGILTISAGILSLARGWGRDARAGLSTAVATGCFIAAYTVSDGLGGRLSGHPVSYAAWLFVADGFPLIPVYAVVRRDLLDLVATDRATAKSAVGGLVSLVAYSAVIVAASVSPMGPVSALRETSVVFAALIGWLFLGETLTVRRLGSCALVAAGAVVLGFAG